MNAVNAVMLNFHRRAVNAEHKLCRKDLISHRRAVNAVMLNFYHPSSLSPLKNAELPSSSDP